eukprot:jgi/Ulvmu1/2180/UM013_0025.1
MSSLSDEAFLAAVLDGPLLAPCNISSESVTENVADWRRLAGVVAQNLGCQDLETASDRQRVLHYYLPVFYWVRQQVTECKKRGKAGPCVVGVSAPQGCGKTTLVGELEKLLAVEGLNAASVSIDDFYMRRSQLVELAEQHPSNSLVQGRGNAGTHDLPLGTQTLQQLQASRDAVKLPRYNKSAYSGAGDRAHPAAWPEVALPVDVVLFEGWMLGFRPVSAAAAAAVDPGLREVNEWLRGYKRAWDAFVDSWLVIEVADAQWVFQWRLQAEQQMRAEGKAGMSDDEVAVFVRRYMPAYEAYLPALYARGPTTARPGRTLFVRVGESRQLLGGRELEGLALPSVPIVAGVAVAVACIALAALLATTHQKRKTR